SLVRAGDLPTAVRVAGQSHLAWIQPFFATVLAPVLAPTPAGFQLLNTLALAVFLAAASRLGRDLGASPPPPYPMALLGLLPDTLANWYAGYQDMQRDAAFFALVGASYFLTLSYLWRPCAWRGVALGLTAGVAVWSRGNAVAYLVAINAPLAAVWVLAQFRRRRFAETAKALALPEAIAAVIGGPEIIGTLTDTAGTHRRTQGLGGSGGEGSHNGKYEQ